MPSNLRPPAASRREAKSEKSARTGRTQGNCARFSAAPSSIDGSSSAQTSRPPGPIRLAISAACPPAPVVPSRKTSPGEGSSNPNVSWKRTGICPVAKGQIPSALISLANSGSSLTSFSNRPSSSCQRASDQTSNRLGIPWMTTSFSSPA